VRESQWSDHIQVFHSSLQEYCQLCKTNYDLIVSNPPFFINSLITPNESRTKARHALTLASDELFEGINKMLTPDGIVQLIIPIDNLPKLLEVAQDFGFFCTEKYRIKPTPDKKTKRVLLEFSRIDKPTVERELIIEDGGRHQYSDAYKQLTRDYYLGC